MDQMESPEEYTEIEEMSMQELLESPEEVGPVFVKVTTTFRQSGPWSVESFGALSPEKEEEILARFEDHDSLDTELIEYFSMTYPIGQDDKVDPEGAAEEAKTICENESDHGNAITAKLLAISTDGIAEAGPQVSLKTPEGGNVEQQAHVRVYGTVGQPTFRAEALEELPQSGAFSVRVPEENGQASASISLGRDARGE